MDTHQIPLSKSQVEDLRKKIDSDLVDLYGQFMFRAVAVAHPPPHLTDGSFIYFRGYLKWCEIPSEERQTIMADWIPELVEKSGFQCY